MKKSTRHNILSVALSVFSNHGITQTTMDDVAKASGYGRRTLYTYFKSREQLFEQVIFRERDAIISQLDYVVNESISTIEKMEKLSFVHMKVIEGLVNINKDLMQEFLNRNDRIDHYRTYIDNHEIKCIQQILTEGNINGTFHVEDIENTASIILCSLKGIERKFIPEGFGEPATETIKLFIKILHEGLKPIQPSING